MSSYDFTRESMGSSSGSRACRIVVLGAGPTGLGAGWRLQELGHDAWDLFEAESYVGGLSTSVTDARGFVWDLGVHVIHSHYPSFDKLLDETLPGAWLEHSREAWIRLGEGYVPYPVQHHIGWLAEEDQRACLAGLREAGQGEHGTAPAHFGQWVLQQFGRGLADLFFFPYNRKIWTCELEEMGVQWITERVASVDRTRGLDDASGRKARVAWGPNAVFRCPRRGGTGVIWNALFDRLAPPRRHLRKQAVRVCPATRSIEFADGTCALYDTLISTIPLDSLLSMMDARPELAAAAAQLRYSSLHVVGIGLDGHVPEDLRGKSWIYFPQRDMPFHRITVFSNFSPHNVPQPDNQWSLLAEVSERKGRPVSPSWVIQETVAGLRRLGVIPPQIRIVDLFHRRLEHAYPTPLTDRDPALQHLLPALAGKRIYSRGRFGAWKYEVGNMDHSFMQGVEVVDRVLLGVPEGTLRLSGEAPVCYSIR